jgi:hypothetical protein
MARPVLLLCGWGAGEAGAEGSWYLLQVACIPASGTGHVCIFIEYVGSVRVALLLVVVGFSRWDSVSGQIVKSTVTS